MDIDDFLVLQLLELEEEEDLYEDEEIIRRAALAGALVYLGVEEYRQRRSARRQRLYLTRAELLPNPRIGTPWQRLYDSQNDRSFITTMGFDVDTFHYLLDAGFRARWNATPIPRQDTIPTAAPRLNRRSLDAEGALGLILHYLSSTMRDVELMEIFALIPSTVSRYIDFAFTILLSVLRYTPESQVLWPDGDDFQEYNELVVRRHPLLTGGFGTMDGLNLPVQESAMEEIENATYNGWLHSHVVSSVIAFGASGEIIACHLNAPGSWHDARIARPIFERLRCQTPDGYYLVTDTAFPRGTDQIQGKIKAPLKSGARLPSDGRERDALMNFNNQLLSFRQAAEWGMRAMQGSFGRLRVPLEITHSSQRGDLLETVVRLYQVRVRRVGINQIRTVYMPTWAENEQDYIWKNFEKMLFKDQRKADRVARFHLVVDED
ncbi:hypothetical protein GALMADRAFT_79452 [Galerina marginata CBS 339.88]|uniref:DDE Tnp4 domain-containing protein n=1 Tax=Galerina marginata (strain CBS 339.88) TaxID=685588 RepID=A0A067SCX8_GALM3|nr:hypothetical protein GALMADRAFT_79452 [Galerina marginata CBS 339.88]